MNRLLLAVALIVATVSTGSAGTVEHQLLASLRAQGYVVVEHSYTLTGRLRVIADNGEMRREILVNPGTGEVLSDHSVAVHPADPTPPEIAADNIAGAVLPDPSVEPDLGSEMSLMDTLPPGVPADLPASSPEINPEILPQSRPEDPPDKTPDKDPVWPGPSDQHDVNDPAPIAWQTGALSTYPDQDD